MNIILFYPLKSRLTILENSPFKVSLTTLEDKQTNFLDRKEIKSITKKLNLIKYLTIKLKSNTILKTLTPYFFPFFMRIIFVIFIHLHFTYQVMVTSQTTRGQNKVILSNTPNIAIIQQAFYSKVDF